MDMLEQIFVGTDSRIFFSAILHIFFSLKKINYFNSDKDIKFEFFNLERRPSLLYLV